MPAVVYALIAVFLVMSLVSGAVAAWLVGPRRPWAALLPAAAAFGILYLAGHRLAWRGGPQVELFGLQVSLALDIALALGAALAVAAAQRLLWAAVSRG